MALTLKLADRFNAAVLKKIDSIREMEAVAVARHALNARYSKALDAADEVERETVAIFLEAVSSTMIVS